MSDIVLGIRIKADGSDLVGTVKGSQEALQKLREETGKTTGEAERLNIAHKTLGQAMNASSRDADAFVARLKREADTLGMTSLQVRAYAASKMQLNDAQSRSVAASLMAIKAHEAEAEKTERLASVVGVASKAFVAFAAAKIAASIASVKSVTAEADDLNKESQALSVHVEWLSKMRYAGDLANVSSDQLRNGLRNLTRQIEEADNRTGNGAQIFNAMGIAISDTTGRVRTLDQILPELADKFAAYAEGPRKTALALELFGRDGLRWVPLLNQGAQGLRENAAEAERLGIVIGGDLSRKSEEFRDNVTRIEAALHGMKVEMAAGVLPTISALVAEMNVFIKTSGSFWAGIGKFATSWDSVALNPQGVRDRLSAHESKLSRWSRATSGHPNLDQSATMTGLQRDIARDRELLAIYNKSGMPDFANVIANGAGKVVAPNLPRIPRGGGGGAAGRAGATDNFLLSITQDLENQLQRLTDGELPAFDALMRKIIASGKEFSDEDLIIPASAAGELDRARKAALDRRIGDDNIRAEVARVEERMRLNEQIDADRRAGNAQAAGMGQRFNEQSTLINASLSRDPARAAYAQFDLEKEEYRKRIDALNTDSEARKQIENDYATWVVARHAQITEELKPEWRKMVDAYGDAAKQMRDFQDRFITGGLRAGEDAFVNWAKTGKLSIKGVFDTLRDEIARTAYRKAVGSVGSDAIGGIGGFLGKLFFGGGGEAAAGGAGGAAGAGDIFGVSAAAIAHGGYGPGDALNNMRAIPSLAFAGAPRLHSGVGPGEMPAVIRTDESVLTPGQMRQLAPAAESGAVSVPITINAPGASDETVARLAAQMRGLQRTLVPRVIDAVRRGGEARRHMGR